MCIYKFKPPFCRITLLFLVILDKQSVLRPLFATTDMECMTFSVKYLPKMTTQDMLYASSSLVNPSLEKT